MSASESGPVAEQQAHVQRAETGEREPVTYVVAENGDRTDFRTADGEPLVLYPGDALIMTTSVGLT